MEIPDIESPPEIALRTRTPYFVRTLRLAAVGSLLMTALAGVSYPFLQPVIPLFYSLSQPADQLAAKIWIFLLPILAWLITIMHFSILRGMKNLEGNIEKIFCWTTVGLVGITGLLLVRVILLVI